MYPSDASVASDASDTSQMFIDEIQSQKGEIIRFFLLLKSSTRRQAAAGPKWKETALSSFAREFGLLYPRGAYVHSRVAASVLASLKRYVVTAFQFAVVVWSFHSLILKCEEAISLEKQDSIVAHHRYK